MVSANRSPSTPCVRKTTPQWSRSGSIIVATRRFESNLDSTTTPRVRSTTAFRRSFSETQEDTMKSRPASRPRCRQAHRCRGEISRRHHHPRHRQGKTLAGRDRRRWTGRPRRSRQADPDRRQGRRRRAVRQMVGHRGQDRRPGSPDHEGVATSWASSISASPRRKPRNASPAFEAKLRSHLGSPEDRSKTTKQE